MEREREKKTAAFNLKSHSSHGKLAKTYIMLIIFFLHV
jgi:hypothetical protein